MKSNFILAAAFCLSASSLQAYSLTVSDNTRHEEQDVVYGAGETINVRHNAFYQGKHITISGTIWGNEALGLHLLADEGKWNTIAELSLQSMMGTSFLSRTKVQNGTVKVHRTMIQDGSPDLVMENVEIKSDNVCLQAYRGTYITNNGSIILEGTSETELSPWQGLIETDYAGKIVLTNATLSLKSQHVIMAGRDSVVSLTNSTINSPTNNKLITGGGYGSRNNIITLDKVNLTKALNQEIEAFDGTLIVNILNETRFDGYVSPNATYTDWGRDYTLPGGNITLNIVAAGWNLTRDSDLGTEGVLSLASNSFLNLYATGGTDFTDIYASAIMIEQGTIINLDVTAFDGGEGTYAILHADKFGQYNHADVNLIGADGSPYIWDTSRLATKGTVTVRFNIIPEPATATLGILGLAAIILRGRRKA